MQAPRHFRVFLASPSDVMEERAIARGVLSRLPYDPFLRGRITIEIVAWDGPGGAVPMTATMTPQEAIDRGLRRPSECDIVIVILWTRLGTPLPDNYRRADGTRYGSGTEWEYEDALFAHRQPQILLYRRVGRGAAEAGDSGQIDRFFAAFESADGSLRGGVNPYGSPTEFESQLDYQVRHILSRLLASSALQDDFLVQPRRLDAATPRQTVTGRPAQVEVQVCERSSIGVIGMRSTSDGYDRSLDLVGSSDMPVLFRRQPGSSEPLPAIATVEVFAPQHHPTRSAQDLLVGPSHDSGVLAFSLEPRGIGAAKIHVALSQQLEGAPRVTCGTVILESSIVSSSSAIESDEFWTIASRLIGTVGDAPNTDPFSRATLTVRIVEDAERNRVEKYLTLDVPGLCLILDATKKAGGSLYSSSGQIEAGQSLFLQLRPLLVDALAKDTDLLAFLNEHPDLSAVDLVLLLEDRITAAVPDYSARVLAAIIAKIGVRHFVE